MRLKILPALHALHLQGTLPPGTRIIGISRRPWDSTQLRAHIQDVLPEAEEAFFSLFTFLQGDAEDLQTFKTLTQELGDDTALLYLSLAPTLYQAACSNMQHAGLGRRQGATRLMIEKPFATSGALAEELYTELLKVTGEQDIYLMDHYLAKDWVRELEVLPAPRDNISQITIRFLETAGVEKRGALYDQLGALRDVVQNHLLQVLASLVAPHSRGEMLEQLEPPSSTQIAATSVRAQYEGYVNIAGVAAESQTETYCKIRIGLTTPGWQGVEVVLEAGKRLPETAKEVVLTLKDTSTLRIVEHPNKTPEYEMLLRAAIEGRHDLFPSIREVRAQWGFIDPICAAWSTGIPKLMMYPPGTMPSSSLL